MNGPIPDDSPNVVFLGPSNTMSAQQALAHAVQRGDIADVLIIGYDADNDFVSISSRMSRKDALWLLELAREHVFVDRG